MSNSLSDVSYGLGVILGGREGGREGEGRGGGGGIMTNKKYKENRGEGRGGRSTSWVPWEKLRRAMQRPRWMS